MDDIKKEIQNQKTELEKLEEMLRQYEYTPPMWQRYLSLVVLTIGILIVIGFYIGAI